MPILTKQPGIPGNSFIADEAVTWCKQNVRGVTSIKLAVDLMQVINHLQIGCEWVLWIVLTFQQFFSYITFGILLRSTGPLDLFVYFTCCVVHTLYCDIYFTHVTLCTYLTIQVVHILQRLVDDQLVLHATGNPKHQFIYGFFFYYFTSSKDKAKGK